MNLPIIGPLCGLPILLAAVAGCDSSYGVNRSAQVRNMPPPGLVGATIRSAPGVEKVQHRTSQGSRPLTITGIHPPDVVHTFIYSGTNIWCCLQFDIDWSGQVAFSQTLTRMGTPPPQRMVDATRPVMKQIELLLEQRCGLAGLSSNVVERCKGVQCD